MAVMEAFDHPQDNDCMRTAKSRLSDGFCCGFGCLALRCFMRACCLVFTGVSVTVCLLNSWWINKIIAMEGRGCQWWCWRSLHLQQKRLLFVYCVEGADSCNKRLHGTFQTINLNHGCYLAWAFWAQQFFFFTLEDEIVEIFLLEHNT